MVIDYPYTAIHVNGREVTLQAIQDNSVSSTSDFERNLFAFINEWLNNKKHFVIPTSGSTGKPKSLTIARSQMIESARLTEQALQLKEDYVSLVCLDPNFIAGKMMLVRSFVTGMKIVATEPSANPLKKIQKNSFIDFAAFVPYQLYEVVRSTEAAGLNNFKTVIIGGAPLDDETQSMLSGFRCSVFATYGMTETISHIALRRLNGNNPTLYYTTLPGVIIHQDERKCLVIQIPYLDHAIPTNDIVELLSPTRFIWLGRWDNIINTGGLKVIPEQLEKSIQTIFQNMNITSRFFITSQPDAQLGNKIILVIESAHLPDALRHAIEAALYNELPKHCRPKNILTVPLFEMTKSGKINRLAVEKSLH